MRRRACLPLCASILPHRDVRVLGRRIFTGGGKAHREIEQLRVTDERDAWRTCRGDEPHLFGATVRMPLMRHIEAVLCECGDDIVPCREIKPIQCGEARCRCRSIHRSFSRSHVSVL